MTGLGTLLEKARTDQGLSIDEMSKRTNIRPRFLQALEKEQYDQLPGDAYVKPFIRTYAKALGLQDEIMTESVEHTPISNEIMVGIRERRERLRTARRKRFAVRFGAAIVILAALGYLIYRFVDF